MKVRMLQPVCGLKPWPNGFQEPFAYEVGAVADLEPFQAHAWIASGRAEPIRKKA